MNALGATGFMISTTTEIYKLLSSEGVFAILEELDLEFDIRLIQHIFTNIGNVDGVLLFCKTEIEKLIKKIKLEIEQIHLKMIDKQWKYMVTSWRITFTENIENLKKYKAVLNNRKKALLQIIELSNSASIAKNINGRMSVLQTLEQNKKETEKLPPEIEQLFSEQ